VCVCVRERERESGVCERERESVCVCVCVCHMIVRITSDFLGVFAKLRKATIRHVRPSARPHWNSASTGRIFLKFDI